MMRKLYLSLFILLWSFCAFSQTRSEWVVYGDEAFAIEDYNTAAYCYEKYFDKSASASKNIVYPYDIKEWTKPKQISTPIGDSLKDKPLNPSELMEKYVTHQLAESSRLINSYNKAEIWYEKSVQLNHADIIEERYWYAVSLMKNGKYAKAQEQLEIYKKELKQNSGPLSNRLDKALLSCYFAMDSANIRKENEITLMDADINSGIANFGANFFGEDNTKMIFSSGRPTNKFSKDNSPENAVYGTDFYTSEKSGKKWGTPKNFTEHVNSELNEAAGTISVDKDKFYFTRWTDGDKKNSAIYLSKYLNGKWLQPMRLNSNVNVQGYSSMQPSLSADASKLYFSSNRPGGKGKMDIWVCHLDESGNPGAAVNLGPMVNTMENEASPFFHQTSSTLYFSSEGHIGLGGMDIYKAYGSETDTTWSSAFNLGRPINSEKEDAYFVLSQDEKTAFLSSDRISCKDCENEYCYKLYSIERDPLIFSVKGRILDRETDEIIPNALITCKDVQGNLLPFYLITDDKGAYSSKLKQDVEYYFKAQKNKYFADAAVVTTKGLTKSTEIIQDLYLSRIPDEDIVIPGIEYDYNKATLRPVSIKVLDTLVEFLNLNNNISIEIGSHTDTRGKDEYNQKLSQERAKSVVDYLISKGIAPARLVPKGYGETKPLVSDEEIAKMKTETNRESGHQKNRRTSFRTTKEEEIRMKKN
jgi:OmpA-OmpF porin, OOP family